jgi:hypothetical protein
VLEVRDPLLRAQQRRAAAGKGVCDPCPVSAFAETDFLFHAATPSFYSSPVPHRFGDGVGGRRVELVVRAVPRFEQRDALVQSSAGRGARA